MASVRSVALDVRSSGTTKTYEKKKHSMTMPAITTTPGTGLGLSVKSQISSKISAGTTIPSRMAWTTCWAVRKTLVEL